MTKVSLNCRADVVPRISYASVEGCFIEFAKSSTIGTLKRRVTQTLEGLKVRYSARKIALKNSKFGGAEL